MTDTMDRALLLMQTQSKMSNEDGGYWRFLLMPSFSEETQPESLDASDFEPGIFGERLALLTLVRSLEALEQPTKVTLVTDNRYIIRGLRYGLDEWRENDWKWHRFGEVTDINYSDLWKRVDNALNFHHLQCRFYRVDSAAVSAVPKPHFARRRQRIRMQQIGGDVNEIQTDSLDMQTGLNRRWMLAAQVVGRELDLRWDHVPELVS